NGAKTVLAFEVTKLIHGEEEAMKAQAAAEALFGGGVNMKDVPTISIPVDMKNALLMDILVHTKVVPSKAEARRLIEQGGLTINDKKIEDKNATLLEEDFKEGSVLIKRGKKKYYSLIIE
ncbi:MAG: tyrosine--tRNA ligase, partial [Clostridiaceae bacterium]|nr:tyrosine--tRNA ligase [Clostridiaceae bacterium]